MVRRWAGHKSYEMTDYYFGLAEAKLAAIKPKQSTLAGVEFLPKKAGRRKKSRVISEAGARCDTESMQALG
jgi:hypothetical protein